MERQATQKWKSNKILKFLPKAAQAAVSFQNPPPFSPGLDRRYDLKQKTPNSKGFSGPIISMIPAEARGRCKNFEAQEPTSPKVSCIGQVRHRNKVYKTKQVSLPKGFRPAVSARPESPAPETGKKPSGMKRIFGSRRKSDAGGEPPRLADARRYASSRDALANFDWRIGESVATPDAEDSCSDEERAGCVDWGNDVVVPFSAAGNGVASEPRKEINLWKRRAMAAQPRPLQLGLIRAR